MTRRRVYPAIVLVALLAAACGADRPGPSGDETLLPRTATELPSFDRRGSTR